MSTLQILALAFFSQPKSDRPIYRLIRRLQPQRIVELGIGNGQRSERIIRLARTFGPVHFVGIDMFEGSPPGVPHMSLKNAHQRLTVLGDEVRLIPGDAGSTLPRRANELTNIDLIIISATQPSASVAVAWSYLPRMLHPTSRVLLETPTATDVTSWRLLTAEEVSTSAAISAKSKRTRAAA